MEAVVLSEITAELMQPLARRQRSQGECKRAVNAILEVEILAMAPFAVQANASVVRFMFYVFDACSRREESKHVLGANGN